MALSVAKPTKQPTITVGKPFKMNGFLQGSNVNPQQTAPSTVLQNPAPASVYHPTYNPQQPTYNPQQAAAATAAAVEVARQAAIQEAARQAEIRRVQVQGEINTKVAANKQTLTVAAQAPKMNIVVSKKAPPLPKIILPKDTRTEYQKAYDDAYSKAMADVKSKIKIGKQNIFQKGWDKVSFGSDRRASAAREYAQKTAVKTADQVVKSYQKNLTGFTSEQAKRKAAIESAKFGSQAEFDAAVKSYNTWESAQIAKLENQRAVANANIDAYGTAASAKLTSVTAKGLSMFNRDVVHGVPGKILGNVWQYTLGSGSENAPSVVTAPGRAVNWLGNLNTKNRQIYQEGGGTTNRATSGKNAWQASFNQRSFNLKPYVDLKPGKAADQAYGNYVKSLIQARKSIGEKDPSKLDYNKVMTQVLKSENQRHRNMNSAVDLAADPINLAGGVGKIGKVTKVTDKLGEAAKSTKAFSWLNKVTTSVADLKAVKWLRAENKTPQQRLYDAIDQAKRAHSDAQSILPRINSINKKIVAAGGGRLDVSVFEDLKNLTDSEAKVLQRMVSGKLAARDRLRLAGNSAARSKLEGIATKWQGFEEQMRKADNVIKTGYGRGKKRMYFARIDYTGDHTLQDYNFYARKKSRGYQSAADLHRNQVDRYFKSEIDNAFAHGQGKKVEMLRARRDALLQKYDQAVMPSRQAVETAYAKTKTPYGRYRTAMSKYSPTAVWKKSVLKYRPAWYVNNALYNTQAAVLAGGGKALIEQGKMLRPKYWRKAMNEIPAELKSNLANEVGKGKLARFGTNLENWSRVAAYRGAKSKGLTDQAALKRVNRYLFDYSTKNWERPIKAVVPFWSFQKNLAKAAAVMPFDRPQAAMAYNRVDRYQQQQYSRDFDTLVPKLKKLGYTDAEIAKFKADNAKYYQGRLKIGGKYYTTPFNAFSEKQMSQLGFNPYLAAGGETADSVDSYGRKVSGTDASWWRRLASKFPQLDLTLQAKKALDVSAGRSKPHATWISTPGHEGYGLTKEKQGYDPSKANYVKSMDPRRGVAKGAGSFLGMPSNLQFDKQQFMKSKTLQKMTGEYFATNWDQITKDKGYAEMQKQQAAMFKKYGMTADEFYSGILSKYDTEQTKAIKKEKGDAAAANKSLFEQYSKVPKGQRNLWATNKLRELVKQGYFDKNPFLKSFDWITPTTVARADKQQRYLNYTPSQKKKDYEAAVASGNWTTYHKKYGYKTQSPYQYAGKYFKTAESMQSYKDMLFWQTYTKSSTAEKKKMLAASPQYNTRSDWTAAMWRTWKSDRKKQQIAAARSKVTDFAQNMDSNAAKARSKSTVFLSSKGGKYKRVKYGLRTA